MQKVKINKNMWYCVGGKNIVCIMVNIVENNNSL